MKTLLQGVQEARALWCEYMRLLQTKSGHWTHPGSPFICECLYTVKANPSLAQFIHEEIVCNFSIRDFITPLGVVEREHTDADVMLARNLMWDTLEALAKFRDHAEKCRVGS